MTINPLPLKKQKSKAKPELVEKNSNNISHDSAAGNESGGYSLNDEETP
eukprot:CAMPEP_0176455054 /NCGR_PEP_ID=MMETSP0127-20121128/30370_1 /TAXON_ID=938130 /ORGANISM="Platyophrya macrostoma, Strain WH" /LENGTH=48 /DNA_ID= /DNA_START= /DNA_END= /DNA_ORIENTATION=